MKKKIFIISSVILLISIGIIINVLNNHKAQAVTSTGDKEEIIETKQKIVCEIKGEVVRPGVYTVEKGTRLNELVDTAGGLTENADISSINLAIIVQDGISYVINSIDNKDSEDNNSLININTASKEELMTLTGIGSSKAQAIIEYRNANGKFNNVNELLNVNGISEKILNQIINNICAK